MSDTPDILKRIIARKHEEISERRRSCSPDLLEQRALSVSPPRGFVDALRTRVDESARGAD